MIRWRHRPRGTAPGGIAFECAAVASALALLALAVPVAAQTSAAATPVAHAAPALRRWGIEAHLGALVAGRFLQAMSSTSQSWPVPAGPVFGTEITVEMDENVYGGMRLIYRFNPRFSAAAGVTGTKVVFTALVRSVSDEVSPFEYDKATTILLDVVFTYDLVAGRSSPYLAAGGGLVSMSFDNADAMNQTRPQLTVGGGYRWHMGDDFDVTLEVRDALFSFDDSAEPLRATADKSYSTRGTLQLWQVGLAGTVWF